MSLNMARWMLWIFAASFLLSLPAQGFQGLEGPSKKEEPVQAHSKQAAGLKEGSDGSRRPYKSQQRAQGAFMPRFGRLGYVPKTMRAVQWQDMQRLRNGKNQKGPRYAKPMAGHCNWTPMGPAPTGRGPWSGRIRALAIDPDNPDRLYVGTAGGGLWKSEDAGRHWSPKTDYQSSMAIGALAIDPVRPNRIFAGTGEYHFASLASGYYGFGLLYSEDHGETWEPRGETQFAGDEISRILLNPSDTLNHLMVSSHQGVFESRDGGISWVSLRPGPTSDILLVPKGNGFDLLAGVDGIGIFRSHFNGAVWTPFEAVVNPVMGHSFPTQVGRIVFGQSRNHPDSVYVAFGTRPGYLAGNFRSNDGGLTWLRLDDPTTGLIWNTGYNFHITVHPDDPHIAFLGIVSLWRRTANQNWTQASGLHMDNHVLAFHPTQPDTVYNGTDGGLYQSTDGGMFWSAHNNDMGSLQIYDFSMHPLWENIGLMGSQDNGGRFYTGIPVWPARRLDYQNDGHMDGDVVNVAIDPHNPARTFYISANGSIKRSENSGGSWTVVSNTATFSPATWLTPFEVDPHVPGVCWAGGNRLWRSANLGETWTAVQDETQPLAGEITDIAFHPTMGSPVYVATNMGRVYKVSAGLLGWITEDLTATGLPENSAISSATLANDGTLWVTLSNVLYAEPSGEFDNDHVYRRPPGAASWEVVSDGLARANPINCLTIDRESGIPYCGGDMGIFRWHEFSRQWELWDQGLPHAPVYQLGIHHPSGMIRATTFGRGIWERPLLDDAPCRDVDLFLRDNMLDSGRHPPPEGVPHPYDLQKQVWHWQSEDIKTDYPPFQTENPVDNAPDFANAIRHETVDRDEDMRIYVRVHNRGPFPATGVTVRAFFAPASGGLPTLPADFWDGGHPFSGQPGGSEWLPVGEAITLDHPLEAGETGVVSWLWRVPPDAPKHSCILALTTSEEDPLPATTERNPDRLVVANKHVSLKNLQVLGSVQSGSGGGSGSREYGSAVMGLHRPQDADDKAELSFLWGSLVEQSKILVVFELIEDRHPLEHLDARKLRALGLTLDESAGRYFEDLADDPFSREIPFDVDRAYWLTPNGDRKTVIPGLQLPEEGALHLAFRVWTPAAGPEDVFHLDVVQTTDGQLVGGNSYQFDPP